MAIEQTPYTNDWDMWVYPPVQPIAPHDEIRITRSLDDETRRDLEEGGKVLLLPIMHTIKGDTSGSFEPIFWNRLWFPTQRVQTLGILCQPEHPALADFPTDMHSNWQWWDICNRCKPMILDELPTQLTPIIQIIDDWNTCRKLAMAFEVRVGKGKLLICSADLYHDLADRPVARQLRKSLLHYMSTDDFAPTAAVPLSMITSLFREPTTLQRLEAKVTASSEQPGYEAVNAIDNRPDSLWHTAWGDNAPRHPHELVVDLHVQHTIRGLVYQPRSDMSNGRIAGFSIYVSRDGQQWGKPWPRHLDRFRNAAAGLAPNATEGPLRKIGCRVRSEWAILCLSRRTRCDYWQIDSQKILLRSVCACVLANGDNGITLHRITRSNTNELDSKRDDLSRTSKYLTRSNSEGSDERMRNMAFFICGLLGVFMTGTIHADNPFLEHGRRPLRCRRLSEIKLEHYAGLRGSDAAAQARDSRDLHQAVYTHL